MRRLLKIAWFAVAVVLLLAAIALFTLQLPTFGGDFEGERLAAMQRSPHYVNGRFENSPPHPGYSLSSLPTTIGNYLGDQQRQPPFPLPVDALSGDAFGAPQPGLRAWWFGHSSTLIEIGSLRVMTDPVFSERASPLSFIGPKRFHRVPLALDQMPPVDAVVVSHDHFDHLDMPSVQALGAKGTHFYVGLGIGAHLEHWGVPPAQIHELDWWDSAQLGPLTIHATPAYHYSGRKSESNATLWAGWVIRSADHKVFYSGDTGYGPHFAEIGKRLGPFDLSLTKVGAYGETWVAIHMTPEQAVQAHLDARAEVMLPVHWGTFNLSYHAWDEPIERTLAAARELHARITTPRIGQLYEAGAPLPEDTWWRQ